MHVNPAAFTPLLFSLFGMVFVFFSHRIAHGTEYLKTVCTERAVGTVACIHEERSRDSDGHYHRTYRPEYEFYDTYSGQLRRCASRVARRPCRIEVGDHSDILYNPSKPAEFIIEQDTRAIATSKTVMDVVGLLFVIFGIVFTLMALFFI